MDIPTRRVFIANAPQTQWQPAIWLDFVNAERPALHMLRLRKGISGFREDGREAAQRNVGSNAAFPWDNGPKPPSAPTSEPQRSTPYD